MNSALAVIHWCIRDCARSRDGRGAWRVERRCADLLGGSAIDINTAAAARRFGEWLRNTKNTPQGADRVPQVLKAEGESPDATVGIARSEVMAPDGSGSPTGRGTNGAPASGAAPAFLSSCPATSLLAGTLPSAGASRPGATS